MAKTPPAKTKAGDIIPGKTYEAPQKQAQDLYHVEQTFKGMPPPSGCASPSLELEQARIAEELRDREVTELFKREQGGGGNGISGGDNGHNQHLDDEQQKLLTKRLAMEQRLTQEDWNTLVVLFQHTGRISVLSQQSGLKPLQVQHLLEFGIARLGLSGIKEHTISQAQVTMRVREQKQQRQLEAYDPEVQVAVQERVAQEAMAAQDLLDQTVQTGSLLGDYLSGLVNMLKEGHSKLVIPEMITPAVLEDLTKVMDAHSRATERAVKLVRLTQGQPTEVMEHQIGMLLTTCTTEELRAAAKGKGLPRRLTSRLGGADPIETNCSMVEDGKIIDSDSPTIDPDDPPTWMRSIVEAEGRSCIYGDGSNEAEAETDERDDDPSVATATSSTKTTGVTGVTGATEG